MASKLDLADAQFIGFHFGKREPGIVPLVLEMGLSKAEWTKWKTRYTSSYLTESEIIEVDEYFKLRTTNNIDKRDIVVKSRRKPEEANENDKLDYIQSIGRIQRQTQAVPVTDISNGKTIVHLID
ncbi:MAG: hypothetical protein IM631_05155 [Cytophagales bacterium]|nr:hypothetical protein [Cytophagales bacterium]MCA6370769.1 hypothetical protein [Cytophagales bacterium]MCA6385931.1 hypothetical protein [Cytophagales bacterium]